jgi:hypothetical protein
MPEKDQSKLGEHTSIGLKANQRIGETCAGELISVNGRPPQKLGTLTFIQQYVTAVKFEPLKVRLSRRQLPIQFLNHLGQFRAKELVHLAQAALGVEGGVFKVVYLSSAPCRGWRRCGRGSFLASVVVLG